MAKLVVMPKLGLTMTEGLVSRWLKAEGDAVKEGEPLFEVETDSYVFMDEDKNNLSHCRNAETCISTDDSPVKIFVIPTDEELVMTEDAFALMNGTYDVHTNFHYTFEDPKYLNKARERGLIENLKKKPELQSIIVRPALA